MLTAAQLATLKAALAANTNTVVVGGTTFAINSNDVLPTDHLAPSDEAASKVAAFYSALAAPAYNTWNPAADKSAIDSQIIKSNFTPSDAVPASPSTDMTYQNRALLCQLKQSNAIWLTQGGGTLDARVAGMRINFKDCLLQIPSGASGANQDAGWGTAAVPGAARLAMQHSATVAEKLFAVAGAGAGNDGVSARGDAKNPDVGASDASGVAIVTLSSQDIKQAWTS